MEESCKKDLIEPYYHDGVVSKPESDILECEVKWALESTAISKASAGDEIPAELFKILKTDAIKVLHSIYQQVWKIQQWQQNKKKSIFIPIPKKSSTKECARQLHLSPMLERSCSKTCMLGFSIT